MAVNSGELRTLPRLKGAQAAASDPRAHVWLSASAGTGKTQVLAARVFREGEEGRSVGVWRILDVRDAETDETDGADFLAVE